MGLQIDWENLGFHYMDTGVYVIRRYRGTQWSEREICTEPYLNLHVAATCLHYGQSCFEGLKAFGRKDGSIGIFRPWENAKRMIRSAQQLAMQAPTEEMFVDACMEVVRKCRDFVPPYGTGASLYIRPLLVGSSARVGVRPSDEYVFIVLAMPVGPYYKDGFFPVNAYVQEAFDRAAPRGIGNIKAAGNYAAGLQGDLDAKKRGFPICLYLDAAKHEYIDEFGTANFFGITKDRHYCTPESSSILPSITNACLQQLARDSGFTVEKRPIRFDEIERFTEIGACGTASVITPIYSLTRGEKNYTFGQPGKSGATLTAFYEKIQGIQYGDIEDRYQWMLPVD